MDLIYFLIDFILHIDVHLAELVAEYGVWVYAILFLILFCETGLVVTPFLPGDSLLFVAGALASLETNDLNVHMMVVLMLIAAIVGDAVNYTIGRLFGEKLFSNPNSKIFRRSYLDKTHQFYEKHGGKTIILASHDMAEVETLCDRIAILKDGKIAFIGTIEQLTAAVGRQYTVHITTPAGRQSFVTDDLTQTLLEKISEYKDKKIEISDIRTDRGTLEQHFIDIARGEQ